MTFLKVSRTSPRRVGLSLTEDLLSNSTDANISLFQCSQSFIVQFININRFFRELYAGKKLGQVLFIE